MTSIGVARRSRTNGNLGAAALAVAVLASLAVGLASLRYLSNDPSVAPPELQASMMSNGWIFVAHAGFSAVALIIGGFQFMGALRKRIPKLHRWLGRVYIVSCAVGGASALWIAPDVGSGTVATIGFSLLGLFWLVVSFCAWRFAVNRDFERHLTFMIRSFALTFSAVTLRLQILAFGALGLGYGDVSVILAFSCWIPNLIVAEWLIRRGGAGRAEALSA